MTALRGALVVAASLLAAEAAAHVVSDRDLQVVRRLPPAATRTIQSRLPDSAGYVRPNQATAWRGVGHQRSAMLLLVDAAARSDSMRAERAWAALERAFAFQRPDGGFEPALGAPAAAGTPVVADDVPMWLASSTRAVIAVMNSPLQNRFRWRYALIKPKLQRSIDALERSSEELLARHARRPELLLATAAALLLADGIYHEERYGRAGQRSLVQALGQQRDDGRFGDGAPRPDDSDRQAVAVDALQSVAIYFPSPTLERAADRGRKWLDRHRKGRGAGAPPDPILVPGEIEFVLGYGAIKPPPPTSATPH